MGETDQGDAMPSDSATIRAAAPADAPAIAAMIRELAEYEGITDPLAFSLEQLRGALDGDPPRLRAVIAEDADGAAGFVSYTIDFAIWSGGDVLRVDDVFVRARARGRGVGRRMMCEIARLALAGGMTARWEIQPENRPAQEFYRGLGVAIRDKIIARWSPDAMRRFAAAD
jgi:ribosomal protein S18 acetylase RimI-like enzyme